MAKLINSLKKCLILTHFKIKALNLSTKYVIKLRHVLVTATCRFAFPSSMTSITSSGLETKRSVAPYKIRAKFYHEAHPQTPSNA